MLIQLQQNGGTMNDKKRLVIIDALNLFIRNYVVNPTLDVDGNPFGGCIGFVKSLQKICKELRPHEIVICWDGIGGSQKKKAMNKDYKAGRKPLRFNRRMIQLDEKNQAENKIYQQIRLYEYLNELPIIQVSIDGIEADDIIAYVSRHKHYEGWRKVIVSSDKDFFQLCDGETVVFRPIQKEVIDRGVLKIRDKIHPNNYALARAIVGDKSDNLPGIRGIGMKTVAKQFPFLLESKQYETEELFKYCEDLEKKISCHRNILANKKVVESNYAMMQLYSPMISYTNKKSIDYNIKEFEYDYNKTNFIKMLMKDGLGSIKFETLYVTMKNIRRNHESNN